MAAPLPLLRFASLVDVPGLLHGVTTRAGGASRGPYRTLNLGRGCGDARPLVERNRAQVCGAFDSDRLETPHQVHGATVAVLERDTTAPATRCDGLLLDRAGPLVGVLGADCPGVLLVAPTRRCLGVVHAGWRGVVAGIVPSALRSMWARSRVAPGEVLAGIGPGISLEHYEVSTDVAQRVASVVPRDARTRVVRPGPGDRARVDLQAAIRAQLVAAGVAPGAIETLASCTFADERFFSHRRDRGLTGRHALVAGWRA